MPAQFTVAAADLKVLLTELRQLDPNLRKHMQAEMRKELKPFSNSLAKKSPAQSPLSGFGFRAQSDSIYRWGSVSGLISTPMGKRAKKPGYYPVVSMKFKSRGKGKAGFEILELAGTKNKGKDRKGMTWRGENLVRGLQTAGYPIQGGLGRFIIPEAKKDAPEVSRIALTVIEKFVKLVNRRIR